MPEFGPISELPSMSESLVARLKDEGRRLGLDWLGIAPAVSPPGYPRLLDWLAADRDAGMTYMRRRADARAHPDRILPGVKTVVVAAIVYGGEPESAPGETEGKVARYARGADYHEVFWRRLDLLLAWIQAERPGTTGRGVADTAPLLERDFARLAGMGWIGKNTMLIGKSLGSYTLLGALLLDLELAADAPFEANHCGTCTRCLDACPTSAFDGPYQLDASRCLSYWTIEHRGQIPPPFREQLEGQLFGCDICQDVCPWNRKANTRIDPQFAQRDEWVDPDLIELLQADPAALSKRIKGTALARAKRTGLVRNAALILGSRRVRQAVPALTRLLEDSDPIIRDAARWALTTIDSPPQAEISAAGTAFSDSPGDK